MNSSQQLKTLAVDIGGSGIKVMVLDPQGNPASDRQRLKTPTPATPAKVIETILILAKEQAYDRISVGFPGVVQKGVIKTAVNLHDDWLQYDLATSLNKLLLKPVKVANDADLQGLGAVSGEGVELVITLGTGFGSALFVEGKLVPNLEMGHHPFRKRETYEQQLGRVALEKAGSEKWNLRLEKAIAILERVFNYDTLYIGGGETKNVKLNLPANVKIIPNVTGLLGGIKLWAE